MEQLTVHGSSRSSPSIVIQVIIQICQEATWPEEEDGVDFHIADGSGVSIEKEKLEVLSDDGKKNFVSWTLSNYLTH